MRFEELSAKDQELLNTDLGDELEKEAAEKVAAVNEVYAYGCGQGEAIAAQIDDMIKLAEEEEKEDEEEEEEEEEEKSASSIEFEKTAAELGSFIERGIFDTLTKLGSENHGDPMYYYYPYIEEKVAAKAAAKAVSGMWDKLVKGVKKYHKGAVKDIKKGVTGDPKKQKFFKKPPKKGEKPTGDYKMMDTKLTTGERAKSVGKGALKLSPYALLAGGGGFGAHKLLKKKD